MIAGLLIIEKIFVYYFLANINMSNFLLSQLLNCWYLDVDFLEELIEEFNVDLDIECIKKEFWNINVNILIYKVFDEIKNNFLK